MRSEETLAGDLLVDATGRRAWATRELRAGEEQQSPLIGVWAVGRKTQIKDRRTVTETGSAGWWYGCLLPTGHSIACLHCDKETAAALVREPQRWWALLVETRLLPRVAAPGDFLDARPRGTDARGVMRRPLVGERWIAIGDAALAFEPIAAHGINKRLDMGTFRVPVAPEEGAAVVAIEERALDDLLDGIDLKAPSRSRRRDAGAADTAEPTIVTAPLPPQILPHALATPSLLAHILSDKFCDGLPFHRQECMA